MNQIVECVPNFSEGRDQTVIKAISREIETTEGVKLLDVDPGADTNRTVITFIGTPEGVKEAAFRAIRKAAELIDMTKHHGEHPRIGAADVCPFVPVSGVTMADCVKLAHELGKRVGDELGVPVYLYEEAATKPERRNLADIRKGEYEGLAEKLKDPAWQPDFGPAEFNPKFGAAIIGAREFLIAYNVNLNTRDRRIAQEIALTLRESGRTRRNAQGNVVRDEKGQALKIPGKLKAVKGVGWYIEEYGQAQVSYNLTNYKITPLHVLFEETCKEAERLGARVTGSELVGLIPLTAMLETGRYFLEKQGKSPGVPEDELIHIAVKSLGLNELSKFEPQKKIIEYQFQEKHGRLAKLPLHKFADELSLDSPTPGGGSTAALAGTLGAALCAMVANLTYGNKKYPDVWEEMKNLACQAQQLKDKLLQLIEQDSEAFNKVMTAFRLPQKTKEEQEAKAKAIEQATKEATLVPLEVMEVSLQAMELAKIAAEGGNVNAISDAGVGTFMDYAAIEGAFLNVKINLPGIQDEKFKADTLAKAEKLVAQARGLKEEIQALVYQKISNKEE